MANDAPTAVGGLSSFGDPTKLNFYDSLIRFKHYRIIVHAEYSS